MCQGVHASGTHRPRARAPEGAGTPHVVVINQEAARRYWPGQDALGQHVTCGQVVEECEVVGNIRQQGPEFPPSRQIYVPLAPTPVATLAVRTAGDPMTVVRAVKKAIWSVNPRDASLRVACRDCRWKVRNQPESRILIPAVET